MNSVFIHSKNNLKKRIIYYILFLIPFLIYGIYKNGILLYQKGIISFYELFQVMYLIILGLVIDFFIRIIFKKKLRFDLDLLMAFIVPMLMPPNISIFHYVIGYLFGIIVSEIINKVLFINKNTIIVICILLILLLTEGINYHNYLEELNIYSFTYTDLLWGRNIGGMASTSILYGIIFIIISTFKNNYKYLIPLSFIVPYLLISSLLTHDFVLISTNSLVIVGIILLNIDSRGTPISKFAQIVYGIASGILTSLVVVYFNNPIIIFTSHLFVNLLYQIIAKTGKKCYNMNDFLTKGN